MFGLTIPDIIARVIVLLTAFSIHELAHAVAAEQLGDSTARNQGRITLNPLAHLDPIGTIMLIIAGFGWAKPVPVNMRNLRGNPLTGMALIAAAGPLSNIMLAVIAVIPFRMGLLFPEFTSQSAIFPSLSFLLTQFIWINIILAVFNMIPIPPLDGSKILFGLLPYEIGRQLYFLEQYGMLILLVLFVAPSISSVFSRIIFEPSAFLFGLLLG